MTILLLYLYKSGTYYEKWDFGYDMDSFSDRYWKDWDRLTLAYKGGKFTKFVGNWM